MTDMNHPGDAGHKDVLVGDAGTRKGSPGVAGSLTGVVDPGFLSYNGLRHS